MVLGGILPREDTALTQGVAMCGNDAYDVPAFIANIRQPMPLGRKLWLITRNISRKVFRLKTCCGHPGEPGC